MSPDATTVPARARWKSSRPPPAEVTMRSSTEGSSVDMAPRSDWLPTSSWSNRTRTGIGVRRGPSPTWPRDIAVIASAASITPAPRRSSSPGCPGAARRSGRGPGRSGGDGCRSWVITSQDRTSAASTPTAAARYPRKSPGSVLTPHSGVRCCWGLSARPSLAPRSRWTASWATRNTGSSMVTSRVWTPSLPRTATRPDRPRSRSSQELNSGPP